MNNKTHDLVIANLNTKVTYMAKQIDGVRIKETPDFISVNCGLPTYNFNIMTLSNNIANKLKKKIQMEVNHFNQKQFPMNIWCWQHNNKSIQMLEEIGLAAYGTTYVAMVAPLKEIHPIAHIPEGFHIKSVASPEEIVQFGKLLSTLYAGSLEAASIRSYFDKVADITLSNQSDMRLYIGIFQDEIVAIGSLMITGDTVGMYDIATVEKVRGMGLGSAMIHFLLNEAKKHDATYCTLQASPDALNIYKKSGFQSVGVLKVFENLHLIRHESPSGI